MNVLTPLLAITIGIDPNVGNAFGLLITWHGIFTAIGIVAGVWIAVSVAQSDRVNIDIDTAYTIGLIVVAAGIIGARALYVIENYGDSPTIDSFPEIFKLTEGGISIYGALIGGTLGGFAYAWWKKLPAAAGADAAAFGLLPGLAIGRIGDIINGEHFAKASDLPWAVFYSNPNSTAFYRAAMHPAVAYELIGDMAIFALIVVAWRFRPKTGVIFCSAFLGYAVMRFFVSYLRIDSHQQFWGMTTPQVVSVLFIIVGVPALFYLLRRQEPAASESGYLAARRRIEISRAERRRRLRTGP